MDTFSKEQKAPRIKEERKRLGLTQQQAAESCGVKRLQWIRYEKGEQDLGGSVLAAFAAAGADPAYILTGVRTNEAEMFVSQKLAASARQAAMEGDSSAADVLFSQALDWQESILRRAEIALKRKDSLREIHFMLCSLSDDEFEEALKAISNIHTTALMRRHR